MADTPARADALPAGDGRQTQFLTVITRDEATERFQRHLKLEPLGHETVAVLDGGLNAWEAAGHDLTDAESQHPHALFTPQLRQEMAVDVHFVESQSPQDGVRLLDARNAQRFRGENETLDPVGGHIPGAVNRFFKDNLERSGRFKPAEVLQAEYRQLMGGRDATEIVHSCGSGVTACHNLLAMEVAGLPGSRLYPGSWSEWCADPSRPIATGN